MTSASKKHHFLSRNRYELVEVSQDWMERGQFEVLRQPWHREQPLKAPGRSREQGNGTSHLELSWS